MEEAFGEHHGVHSSLGIMIVLEVYCALKIHGEVIMLFTASVMFSYNKQYIFMGSVGPLINKSFPSYVLYSIF